MTSIPAPPPRAAGLGLRALGTGAVVRLGALAALSLYAAEHWATIVEPAARGDLFGLFVVAIACGLAARGVAALPSRAVRLAAVAALALVTLAAILLVGNVPLRLLRPDRWDTLASGIGGALGAIPALRVPYTGVDPWLHIVLRTGGGLLLTAAACLGLARRPRTFAAAVCLGVLYTVPIIEAGPRHPYLDGAVFTVLLGVLVLGERLGPREAPMAAGLGAAALVAAVLVAPHLDSRSPWVDYEALAESLQSGKTTTFSWNQRYGPIMWTRDGLEMARIRSRGNLYFKTTALERFDGVGWRQTRDVLANSDDTELAVRHPGWFQTIHVSIKGLKSRPFIGAGTTLRVERSTKPVQPATPGTFEASGTPLRRGDSYDAAVYYPRPSTTEMQVAGTDYPVIVLRDLTVGLPAQAGLGPLDVDFAAWGSDGLTTARAANGFDRIDPDQVLADSPYGRTYALARQIRAASTDPYDYVRNVIARVQRGARYTENPPAPGDLAPLDAFLFRDRAGYCQYFAGATALLLRMGGVPARMAAGFSPGLLTSGEHRLSDLDAHAWVEVYFPRLGWVTFDPTPGDSPARSQITDTQRAAESIKNAAPQAQQGSDRLTDPTAGGAAGVGAQDGGGSPLALIAGIVGGWAWWRPARRSPCASAGGGAAPIPTSTSCAWRSRAPAARRRRRRRWPGSSGCWATARARWATCVRCAWRATAGSPRRRRPRSAARCAARSSRAWAPAPGWPRCGRSRRARASCGMCCGCGAGAPTLAEMTEADVYDLFRQGTELLERGDHHAATVPLGRARELAPDKDSVREAYGRALFGAQRFREAAEEFGAVAEHAPTNDYALFCLGRALQQLGRHAEARHPLALACNLQPQRADYRRYRDQARRRAA
ncbi:transglutaminase-like domain-containing protein [Baekduia soli]|nr:transglutaminaseTgpA domain-containing protein [Baekduia soli]